MSKIGYIARYMLIVKRLKGKPPVGYEELVRYMEREMQYLHMQDDTLDIGFSQRTFQRDIRDIRNIFGIDIVYSRRDKGYIISQGEAENLNFQRMMEAFDMFSSLNIARDMSPHIHLEKRKPQGTENFHGLLHAIKNKKQIRFSYHKFWEDTFTARTAGPYALKESKNRWYVLAKDLGDGLVKSFALDRLSGLEITNLPFDPPAPFDAEEYYRYCFGIIGPNESKPQEVVLSFTPFQGKYIKSLPLHDTQEVLLDSEKEVRVRLTVFLTHDFIMELLSFGEEVRVVQPEILIKTIRKAHEASFKLYKDG